ncbi:LTA synthase family protein [Isachenkonia alkalipeptolytica]|uniref:LTA synthase family protein n=1 Tax=Isachenkonia alkalipeptolytica TaxID=2565777 RepID=A0AA43XJY6_9CLOT|nr:alkaline phosphatase family protein [Isachenkonia alkalipeptolytica]NBG87275.1 LTA synthase family protein [Isachenkonia alkalipeptolytica]
MDRNRRKNRREVYRKRNEKEEKKSRGLSMFFLPGFLWAGIYYLETLVRLGTSGNVISWGLFFSLIFGGVLALLIYGGATLLGEKSRRITLGIILFLLGFIFASQLVYYNMFGTFNTIYSVRHAGQATEFWREALYEIGRNWYLVLLAFVPFGLYLFIGKKINNTPKRRPYVLGLILAAAVLFHLIGIGVVHTQDQGENSPYNLYYNIHFPRFSVDNLGLITYTRLDAQRQITGWTPVFVGEMPEELEEDPDETSNDEDVEEDQDREEENFEDSDEDKEEPEEEPREYNVLNIDFDELMEEENQEEILELHRYFRNQAPSEKNEYTGKYEGHNLIVITAEAFSHLALNEEVTPTLYKLVHEGYYFEDFYTPIWGVSTLDGEYVANTGLIPKSGVWSFRESSDNAMPFAFGNQLDPLGYETRAYHNHTYTYYDRHLSHPNLGYKYQGIGNGLDITRTWPASDLEMMEVTIPEYIEEEPFHTYYLTMSGHLQYSFEGNNMAMKNREVVSHLPYSQQARAYLATQVELDRAMEHLLEQLEEQGIAEETLIVMSSDHYPYGLDHETIEELQGEPVDQNFELYRNAFVLYHPDMEEKVFTEPASSLDIMPTVSNLMGLEFDSRLFMGRDLFSDTDPLVIFENRSFITDKGKYNAETEEFTPREGVSVPEDYQEEISNQVSAKFYFSARILDLDYYRIIEEALED